MPRHLSSGICRYLAAAAVALLAFPAAAQKRVALVIGNCAYTHAAALANPANDARDMAGVLSSLGFETILGLDLDKRAFDAKVRDFSRAGAGGRGPVLLCRPRPEGGRPQSSRSRGRGAAERARSRFRDGIAGYFVLKQMELEREGKTSIVFLDACRDNPLVRAGRNSPFAAALTSTVTQPGLSLTGVMIEVRKAVLAATGGGRCRGTTPP